jgi:hypothetical protein
MEVSYLSGYSGTDSRNAGSTSTRCPSRWRSRPDGGNLRVNRDHSIEAVQGPDGDATHDGYVIACHLTVARGSQ